MYIWEVCELHLCHLLIVKEMIQNFSTRPSKLFACFLFSFPLFSSPLFFINMTIHIWIGLEGKAGENLSSICEIYVSVDHSL